MRVTKQHNRLGRRSDECKAQRTLCLLLRRPMAAEARPLAEHLAEYKEQGYTVFAALHGVE